MNSIICGDSAVELKRLADCSVDMVLTDPPYGIAFMGREWDKALPDPAIWRECLRVLKPGAFAFAMSGSRADCLWRLVRDLEEAGFACGHSVITWAYRTGFPKSLNIGKDFDRAAFVEWCMETPDGESESRADLMGWGPADLRKAASAAVNGAWEKPGGARNPEGWECDRWAGDMTSTMGFAPDRSDGARLLAALQSRFGPAPGVRCGNGVLYRSGDHTKGTWALAQGTYSSEGYDVMLTAPSTPLAVQWDGWHSPGLKPAFEFVIVAQRPYRGPVRENVREWGVGGFNVDECRVPFAGDGDLASASTTHGLSEQRTYCDSNFGRTAVQDAPANDGGRYPANLLVSDEALGPEDSRFFSVDAWAKARGLTDDWLAAAQAGIVQVAKPSRAEKERGCEGLPGHATVKPVALMSYLLTLACKPGGTVLDPFAGSGTTGVAAVQGGWGCILVEREPEYCEIIEARIAAALADRAPEAEPEPQLQEALPL